MSDKHTEPYVPAPLHICVRCEVYHLPFNLFWVDDMPRWICGDCLDAIGLEREQRPTLADHLKSLEPRWVPVSERLPEFDGQGGWGGLALYENGDMVVDLYLKESFMDPAHYGITHWLDFTPPELPWEEVGG